MSNSLIYPFDLKRDVIARKQQTQFMIATPLYFPNGEEGKESRKDLLFLPHKTELIIAGAWWWFVTIVTENKQWHALNLSFTFEIV